MIGPLADMHDNGKKVVEIVHVCAVVRGVAQLQLEWEHHSVVQLAHPARTHPPSVPTSGP